MEASDEALVLACRRGDEAAWEALVRRYQRLIYAVPRRAGLDEDLSAEVFQQVFAALFESLERIEQPEKLHAWLVTTARRETWRVVRREKITGRTTGGEAEDTTRKVEMADNAPLPDEVLLAVEEQHLVRTAVAALDERCRKLVTLLFYQPESLPYAEIAARLGISEGSIGPTRARCLQKLLRLLKESLA